MSDEMAKTDSAAEESSLNGEAASLSSVAECPEAPGEVSSVPASPKNEETPDSLQDEKMDIDPSIEVKFERQDSDGEVQDTPDNIENKIDTPNEPKAELDTEKPIKDDKRGLKRRASEAFNNEDQEFKGFDIKEDTSITLDYVKVLDRLEAEVAAAIVGFTPLKSVMATPPVPVRASKRSRQDTDSSRPSSALSSRSESDGLSTETAASPGAGRRRTTTTEMSSPLLRVPIDKGWKRELVYRAALDAHSRRNADIYYYTPTGKKLRSTREVSEHLAGTGLTLENFSFFKEPLGLDDPEKEIIRDAKVMRKGESPVVARTANKVASPEHTTAAKLKVKSMGSRLSTSTPKQAPKPQKKPAATTDNNNSAAWKKPIEEKRRTRVTNGSSTISPVTSPLEVTSPRRRGRSKVDDTDYVTAFFDKASELKYDVVVQIFQYVGMRELAACARVSRPWRALAATRALWRHVRMKNAHVSDWGGLCALLKKRGTKRLDLRKMLLPQNDAAFWEQFSEHIPSVDSLERIELCRCPASVVESVCRSLPGLRSISALAIKDALLDPSPLASLTHLQELRLKSMAGLSLTRDLKPIAGLQQLQHLSLTSIKELGWCACDVLGSLTNLEVLELGECTFGAEFGNVLAKLTRLKRLRLERGTSGCAAPALLRALSQLPALTRLELVNFDVKVGFDDALAECKNIQRLLIIPTYVSQSATTNKQVLSGVLRLKDTLTHLMWGVTIELLRVTELFIDQCSGGAGRRDVGECIPVLKPVPGCRLAPAPPARLQPPQVEILPLPMLQRLLSAQLPNTKLKLLRIPFHATWRQSLNDFQ